MRRLVLDIVFEGLLLNSLLLFEVVIKIHLLVHTATYCHLIVRTRVIWSSACSSHHLLLLLLRISKKFIDLFACVTD